MTGAVTSAIGGFVGAGMAGVLGQASTFGGAVLRGAAGGVIVSGKRLTRSRKYLFGSKSLFN